MKMHRRFFFFLASHSRDSDTLLLKTRAEVHYFEVHYFEVYYFEVYYFHIVHQFALVDAAFYFPQLEIFTASQSANIGYFRLRKNGRFHHGYWEKMFFIVTNSDNGRPVARCICK